MFKFVAEDFILISFFAIWISSTAAKKDQNDRIKIGECTSGESGTLSILKFAHLDFFFLKNKRAQNKFSLFPHCANVVFTLRPKVSITFSFRWFV